MANGKRRLGVAVLVEPPIGTEIDGLRRALADPGWERMPPHVTLVPPVNVRGDDLSRALARLRQAAARLEGPVTLTMGPPATFLPANPVLYLPVGGDLAELRVLREAVFGPPLERPLSWPWVPHVTLADNASRDRIAAAITALDHYSVVATAERVVLMEETAQASDEGLRARRWIPVADAVFGRPAVVGRGGLATELARSTVIDPEAAAALEDVVWVGPPGSIVRTARQDGAVVAAGQAWLDDRGGHVAVFVAPEHRRRGIGSMLLAQLESDVRDAGWRCRELGGLGPAGFFRARSWWVVPDPAGSGPYSNSTEA